MGFVWRGVTKNESENKMRDKRRPRSISQALTYGCHRAH
jgi:hypothetical protein